MCCYLLFQMLKEISISKPESVQCDVCKLIVTLVQKEVEQNKTEVCLSLSLSLSSYPCPCHSQAEVKQLVEDLCDDLGSLKDECLLLVDTYFDQIWNLITSELVGMCYGP